LSSFVFFIRLLPEIDSSILALIKPLIKIKAPVDIEPLVLPLVKIKPLVLPLVKIKPLVDIEPLILTLVKPLVKALVKPLVHTADRGLADVGALVGAGLLDLVLVKLGLLDGLLANRAVAVGPADRILHAAAALRSGLGEVGRRLRT
jgi:hypothetical protein